MLGRCFQTTVEGFHLISPLAYGVPNTIAQYVPAEVLSRLRGQTITFGVWMRAVERDIKLAPIVNQAWLFCASPPCFRGMEILYFYFSAAAAEWLRCVLGMPEPFVHRLV